MDNIRYFGVTVFAGDDVVIRQQANYFTNMQEINSICKEVENYWSEKLGPEIEVFPDYIEYEPAEIALMTV